MASSAEPRIAIIGGGPSGLVLLLTLFKHGIPAMVYEREVSSDARAHLGGMLDLEWSSGQRALRENGLEELFVKYSRAGDAEETRICGKAGVPLIHRKKEKPTNGDLRESRPEIDRRALRELLLGAVPQESVKWGHALASVCLLDEGRHELTFTNGLVTVVDFLVGADGANSRVRLLLSSATLQYHGVTGVEISLSPDSASASENHDVSDAVGMGSCYCGEDNKIFTTQRNGDGRIRAYLWHRNALTWALPNNPKDAKKALLDLFSDWAPWHRKIIELCDESAIYLRPLLYLPIGHCWDHKPGVTLIGDAAHLMSPFAAAGVNLAMLDALELGLVLGASITSGASVEKRGADIVDWEEQMLERAEKWAALAKRNLETCVSPGAPQSILETLKDGFGKV
ncbi:monooxygenase FAD-binding protein [Cubamyces lactineus]|nr:monooxygenase FAD-binding protein [Cubamyces lactineus]